MTAALAGDPDSLFLVAFPVDGATITREWLSLGGTGNLIVNNSLRSDDFIKAVGAQYRRWIEPQHHPAHLWYRGRTARRRGGHRPFLRLFAI